MLSNGGRLAFHYYEEGVKGVPKLEIDEKNGFVICIFDLVMGYATLTENGMRGNDSSDIADYSTFQRIFTGQENIIARWRNALNITAVSEQEAGLGNGTEKVYLEKKYSVGDYFYGYIPSASNSTSFQNSPTDSTFISQLADDGITIHCYLELTDKDMLSLYLIPRITQK